MSEIDATSEPATAQQAVRRLLITMADELTHNEPGRPLTGSGRVALILRHTSGKGLYDLTLMQAPRITSPITRGQYAADLRQIAGVR